MMEDFLEKLKKFNYGGNIFIKLYIFKRSLEALE